MYIQFFYSIICKDYRLVVYCVAQIDQIIPFLKRIHIFKKKKIIIMNVNIYFIIVQVLCAIPILFPVKKKNCHTPKNGSLEQKTYKTIFKVLFRFNLVINKNYLNLLNNTISEKN